VTSFDGNFCGLIIGMHETLQFGQKTQKKKKLPYPYSQWRYRGRESKSGRFGHFSIPATDLPISISTSIAWIEV
jgi:hypothetical protein